MKTHFYNLTKFDIFVKREDDTDLFLAASDKPIEIETLYADVYTQGGVSFVRRISSIPDQSPTLPPPDPMVFYVVTDEVQRALPQRRDLVVPADVLKSLEDGSIYCQSLALR